MSHEKDLSVGLEKGDREKMKKITIMVIIILAISGCASSENMEFSSEKIHMDRAYINIYRDNSSIIDVEEWMFVSDDMILIKSSEGVTYMLDKTNVTFIKNAGE